MVEPALQSKGTAEDQLQRILHILPAVAGSGGRSPADLARELGVSTDQVLDDVQEVADRAYYHPAGTGSKIRVEIEPERIHVETGGDFDRPLRLTPGEAVALSLALRVWSVRSTSGPSPEALNLARRLEAQARDAPRTAIESAMQLNQGDSPHGVEELVFQAARDRTPCRIHYLGAGAKGPTDRVVHPYVLIHAEGAWYATGHCEFRGGVRNFKLDRVLSAQLEPGSFDVPDDFDPDDHIRDGKVFRAEEEIEVTVRYAPRIAPWILEKAGAEATPEGFAVIRHRVANPTWIVRHVLRYGGDAVVVGPASVRAMVREAVGWGSP